MIGNDIVDLKMAAIQSHWKRKNFLKKIFTEQEQKFIFNSSNPFKKVWLLWSMKESAYKIHIQQGAKHFFNPKKLCCSIFAGNKGEVEVYTKKYMTTSQIEDDFIHTISKLYENKNVLSAVFKCKEDTYQVQHQESYKKVVAAISTKMNIPISKIQIKKNKVRVPKLFIGTKEMPILLSLSHHGNFGAYAILK